MKNFFSQKQINYNGSQLRSLWIQEEFGFSGDAVAVFIGGCDVKPEYMVDLEDLHAGASIYSEEMLHFIVEHFNTTLKEITLKQRIFICILKEALEHLIPDITIKRSGDDLFEEDCKLTISVATTSPRSGLIHAGINVSNKNTPVLTKGLKDFGIDPRMFGAFVAQNYILELSSIEQATQKVKRVE